MFRPKIILFIFLFTSSAIFSCWQSAASPTHCRRKATINHQQVFVDTTTSKRGEGLRHILKKDPEAIKHLNTYQEDNNRYKWLHASLGTVGTGLLLWGLMREKSRSGITGKRTILVTGAGLIMANFLVYTTMRQANEANFRKAIIKYNQDNTPKIHFGPLPTEKSGGTNGASTNVTSWMLGVSKKF